MNIMSYSKWKPWTWLSQIKRLESEITVVSQVHENYCEHVELALKIYKFGALIDNGASTVVGRIHRIGGALIQAEGDRDYWKAKYKADEAKMTMLMKRAVNIQTELNQISNLDLKNRPNTLAMTKNANKELPHHFRMTTMEDWMSLEEAQKKAKLSQPKEETDEAS